MKSNSVKDLVKQDHETLSELFQNEKHDFLDLHISEIINSNDSNRMYGVLILFKEYRNDKMFKSCLETIETKLKNNGFDIR